MICGKSWFNSTKLKRDIKRYPRNWGCHSASVENKPWWGRLTFSKVARHARKNPIVLELKYIFKNNLNREMGCMFELPEESHYYASTTKYLAYNTPNSNGTSHNHKHYIWRVVNKAWCKVQHSYCETRRRIADVLEKCEVQKAQETWSKLMTRWMHPLSENTGEEICTHQN